MDERVHAFIVRPFGEKEGVNFEMVEQTLIQPALRELGIRGETTKEIVSQGAILEDVFHGLVFADLVIADISIHNANVFYELGARHALRHLHTFLLRARVGSTEVPFDIRGERYLEYDVKDPAAAVEKLTEALRATLASAKGDSPVFRLLPQMKPQEPSKLVSVPVDFREEVELATGNGKGQFDRARLELLANEARNFRWAKAGLRLIADAQFEHKAMTDAIRNYKAIVELPGTEDVGAWQRLSTMYQKAGELQKSKQALERADPLLPAYGTERAELEALRGSNAKAEWRKEWEALPHLERRKVALRSPRLEQARAAYGVGYLADPAHYFSGINALALTALRLELAQAEPVEWEKLFRTQRAAQDERARLEEERVLVEGAVGFALKAALARDPAATDRAWVEVTLADHAFISACPDAFVESEYKKAATQLTPFQLTSASQQIRLFVDLGIREARARAALRGLGLVEAPPAAPTPPATSGEIVRTLAFTGHRLDSPQRTTPRFPAHAEPRARAWIRSTIERVLATRPQVKWRGVAGCADGGDILFHEVCEELGIETEVLLAAPPDDFARESVASAWRHRYDRLRHRGPTRQLQETLLLPRWLRELKGYSIWDRNNLWTLFRAFVLGTDGVTLLALWNGEGGDGPGGTADMVARAQDLGVEVVHLDAKNLLTPAPG